MGEIMDLHIQYLTNNKGMKTAVLIPFKEWTNLIKDYRHIKQLIKVRTSLEEAFEEVRQIEEGKGKKVSLEEFLNEC